MVNKVLLLGAFLMIGPCFIKSQSTWDHHGAIIQSDHTLPKIYLCFTGHDYADGFELVLSVLDSFGIKASFFLTGDFIRNQSLLTQRIINEKHYLGIHSDQHLLYNDWEDRNRLLIAPELIKEDIENNLKELYGLGVFHSPIWMPPYEWYNKQVTEIALELGLTTVNFSPGTRSNADYTTPKMKNYISSEDIFQSIVSFEKKEGMNGFHLLIHPGVSPDRKDKFYYRLSDLIKYLQGKGYQFQSFRDYLIPTND